MKQSNPSAVAAGKMFSITHQIVESDTVAVDCFIKLHLHIHRFLINQYGQILCECPGQVDQMFLFIRCEHGHSHVLRPCDVANNFFTVVPSSKGIIIKDIDYQQCFHHHAIAFGVFIIESKLLVPEFAV